MNRGSLRVVSLIKKLLRYAPSLELQESLVNARKAGTAPNTLLVVQHHPVFTVGKRGTDKDLLVNEKELEDLDIDVVRVPRGGETTYHGPGQLVAYPILDLRQLGLGARAYVEALEDSIIHAVGCFGIQARGRVPGKTGVWVGERKIGAVGVRITHGVSSHGIALNVTTDLGSYQHIVPCGTPDKEVTSVLQELQRAGQWKLIERSRSCTTSVEGNAASHLQYTDGCGLELASSPTVLLTAAEQCLIDSIANTLGLQVEASACGDVLAGLGVTGAQDASSVMT